MPRRVESEDRGRVPRVVIAEDEMVLALSLQAQLEALGVQVVGVAADGRTALEICREQRPDAVLMDIRMPVMDGLEASRRIMAECPTRVIILSAYSTPAIRAEAAAAGAADYLTKPVDLSRVQALLLDRVESR